MCGINGIYFLYGQDNGQSAVHIKAMNDAIAHRGPDDEGYWCNAEATLHLGHRRLSIIDLSAAGHQPMTDQEGDAIVFNGEIYNYKELQYLVQGGSPLQSDSDTEVLLRLLKKENEKALQRLNGMFAFAWWNSEKMELLLARDRAGKKPLYYTFQNGIFCFSSEIKSLLRLPWIKAECDQEALYHFLTYNQLPPPYTLFKGIGKLAPGERMLVNKNGHSIAPYWEIEPEDWSARSEAEIADTLYHLLDDSVKYRMVADVPVGAFLSGGVDSSAVVALMRRHHTGTIKTFSVGFEGQPGYDERIHADAIARKYGTEHHEKIVRPGDIADSLPAIIESFDEPMADATCIPIWFIAQLARQHNTIVVQTGDGADELFAGYNAWMRYRKIEPYYILLRRLPTAARRAFASLANGILSEGHPAREIIARASLQQELFWGGARAFKESEKASSLSATFAEATAGLSSYAVIQSYRKDFEVLQQKHPHLSPIDWMCYLGFKFQIPSKYLYRMDRLGMAASIEIRNPFLDYRMVNAAFSVPSELKIKNNTPKYILKKSLERLLPHDILYRKKMGFCVPLQEWAGEIMLDYVETHRREFTRNTDIFSDDGLKRQLQAIRKGNTAYTNQLWTIYFMMAWFKKWMSA